MKLSEYLTAEPGPGPGATPTPAPGGGDLAETNALLRELITILAAMATHLGVTF